MVMHRDLRMRKFLQVTLLSAELIGIPSNNKFGKSVGYIHDNKSWERCYVSEFFDWYILIIQEWTNFINIREWPSSALRISSLMLIIGHSSQIYCHKPIYEMSQMTKLMKNSQYQNILLRIQKIYVLSYHICGMKEINISIIITM